METAAVAAPAEEEEDEEDDEEEVVEVVVVVETADGRVSSATSGGIPPSSATSLWLSGASRVRLHSAPAACACTSGGEPSSKAIRHGTAPS
jgi:hypothetical protein